MKKPLELVISISGSNFHVKPIGIPGVWGLAPTANEAIGNMILANPRALGFEINQNLLPEDKKVRN